MMNNFEIDASRQCYKSSVIDKTKCFSFVDLLHLDFIKLRERIKKKNTHNFFFIIETH